MLRCCIVCRAAESPDLQLKYCGGCQSALYCSQACQKIDWRKQHNKLCKLLNVGHGGMQVRNPFHMSRSIELKEEFESIELSLGEDMKRFFKLFEESTFDGRRVAARKMREIAERQTNIQRKALLFHSLHFLARFSDSKMLSWPSSPLLVLLQFVGPNVLIGGEDAPLQERETRFTLLHRLADLANPSDYTTHKNQLILAKQFIEHGANVNAASIPNGTTPLHHACHACNVTNLDFIELLLEKGADPNTQDHTGKTPLMCTTPATPGATKFLLKWPTTDVNIATRSGLTILARVREAAECLAGESARPDNPDQIQHQFLLQQWRDIEVMLVERSP
jgi:hypothetical protein